MLGVFLLTLSAFAQTTNTTSRVDYSNFRVIADRNIFNPNRVARYYRSERRESNPNRTGGDYFSLVGTMLYQKGSFAFFDGTSSDYKQVVEPGAAIAGYTVKEILPKSVKLVANGKETEMKIGAQMRREDGHWQLLGPSEWTPPAAETASAASATSTTTTASVPDTGSGPEVNDVLKRLMEKREKENK